MTTVVEPQPDSIYPPRTYSMDEHLRCLVRKEILVLIPIYCLGLIPATTLGALLIMKLERRLGLPSLADWLPFWFRVAFFATCLVVGALIVAWCYTWLVLEGGGGPVPPFSARTRYFVTTGPYAYMRHPSLWGKLIGVIGLGVFLGSYVFLTVMIPLLLYWSLVSNTKRQDDGMLKLFGEPYRRYRDATPRMVPRAVAVLLGFA